MTDEKIRLSQKEVKTFNALKEMGGVHFPVFKDKTNYYKLPLSELEELANKNIIVLPYEAATYTQINEYTQSGKQVIIYYMGVDDDQFWTLSHKTAESSYVFTWLNGNSLVKMTLSSGGVWSEEVINLKAIKDNAYDSVTDPINSDNITEVQELTFFRDVGNDSKQTLVMSEERVYGLLMPSPSSEADIGKVPMLNSLGQIVWENVQTQDSETIEHILDLSTLDEENSTFDVVLTANRNNAISFVETSEQTAIVAIEIEDDKPYNIQIVGACTLAITGVEWWGDAITDIAHKSEINIMNGRAIGVLIDV